MGIKGTPVIDLTAQTLYVIAYTLINNAPTHQLHALNLSDLTDKVPAVTVAATHILSNGATYTFNAAVQRNRVRREAPREEAVSVQVSFADASGRTSGPAGLVCCVASLGSADFRTTTR